MVKNIGMETSRIIQRSKPPKQNLIPDALRHLKQDSNIVILFAGKGNARVVMRSTEYKKKIREILNPSVYNKLKETYWPTHHRLGVRIKEIRSFSSETLWDNKNTQTGYSPNTNCSAIGGPRLQNILQSSWRWLTTQILYQGFRSKDEITQSHSITRKTIRLHTIFRQQSTYRKISVVYSHKKCNHSDFYSYLL